MIAQHWKIGWVTVAAAFVIAVSSNYLLFLLLQWWTHDEQGQR
jgi:hypothetical protein